MCSHYQEAAATGIAAKDFITPVVAIIAATMTYIGIFVKINNDRRVRWLDEFRIEIAKVMTWLNVLDNHIRLNGDAYTPTKEKLLHDITLSLNMIELLIINNEEKHKNLRREVNATMTTISEKNLTREALDKHLIQITSLSKIIMKAEIKKIEDILSSGQNT